MAKKIKFPLEMADGVEVRSIDELKEHFSLEKTFIYLTDGRLISWLKDRNLNDMADEIEKIDKSDETALRSLCEILGVKYDVKEGERILSFNKLKEYNKENNIMSDANEKYTDDNNDVSAAKIEDLHISSMKRINKGEGLTIQNKKVHIGTYISCEGKLTFENCIIYYNDTDASNEIILADTAELRLNKCVVVCMGLNNNPFISGNGRNLVHIEQSTFIDCSHFMNLKECKKFIIKNCEMKNCCNEFLFISATDNAVVEISNNVIIEDNISDFNKNKPLAHMCHSYGRLIHIEGYPNIRCMFSGNTIEETEGFNRCDCSQDDNNNYIYYFSSDNAKIFGCTFIGISKAIETNYISDCKFIGCHEGIYTIRRYDKNKAQIDNCLFKECTNVINCSRKEAQITNCQFISCYDRLITGYCYGGIEIEFCEFINTTCDYTNEKSSFSCISLLCDDNSESKSNYIRDCIFNGAEMNNGFLVAARREERLFEPKKTVAYLENCDFKNCTTKHSGCGIIKKHITYDELFKDNLQFKAIRTDSKCRGLDKINSGNSKAEKITVKTQNSKTGNIIGSLISVISCNYVIGATIVLGAPLALSVAAGIAMAKCVKSLIESDSSEETVNFNMSNMKNGKVLFSKAVMVEGEIYTESLTDDFILTETNSIEGLERFAIEQIFRSHGFLRVRLDGINAVKDEQFLNPAYQDYKYVDMCLGENHEYLPTIEDVLENRNVRVVENDGHVYNTKISTQLLNNIPLMLEFGSYEALCGKILAEREAIEEEMRKIQKN